MNPRETLESLEREMREELTGRILPFWSDRALDRENGGFIGWIGPDGVPRPSAPKGAILNSRILWAFSAAFRVLGDDRLRTLADRAASFVMEQLVDPTRGGVYWAVDPGGKTVDDRKHVYAQAFAVYGLAEHHRATGAPESLDAARGIFRLIEGHAHDAAFGGYREAFRRDWSPLADPRLGDTDLDAPRSENTHLHVLEAYTTLHQVWPDPLVASRLRSLVRLFVDRIVDPSGHARPFFDRDWTVRSEVVSFGHDIETSWLLAEAAAGLGDAGLKERVTDVSTLLANAVLREGLDPEGGVFYEAHPGGAVDREKEWWTQAEAVVGFLHAYQTTDRPEFLAAAWDTWTFIRTYVVDREGGEWRRRVARDGTPLPGRQMVGPWKGPYHNVRACLEVMERTASMRMAGR
jgi:mannobiose 2-epimerase